MGNSKRGYEPLAYAAVKAHSLNLRSLLNDDMIPMSDRERRMQQEEARRRAKKDRLEEFNSLDKQLASLTELDIRAIREENKKESALLDGGKTSTSTVGDDSEGEKEEVWTTWKARKKDGGEKVVKHCIDYILYAPPATHTENAIGVRALGLLDLLRTDEVGPDYLPSSFYPSDHIAIAADLEIIGYLRKSTKPVSAPTSTPEEEL